MRMKTIVVVISAESPDYNPKRLFCPIWAHLARLAGSRNGMVHAAVHRQASAAEEKEPYYAVKSGCSGGGRLRVGERANPEEETMPTYEYECQRCSYTFELFQGINDRPRSRCPKCRGKVQRLIGNGVGIVFKGSGFYVTDSRKKSTSSPQIGDAGKAAAKATDKSTDKATGKATDKAANKPATPKNSKSAA